MNTFTFENTKEATHAVIYPHKVSFLCNDTDEILHNDMTKWRRSERVSDFNSYLIELSRPAGERKEDHTIDGVVTYALKYKLDDNPDEPVKEPESMIGSSEYYQTGGNPQTIEPWVGDQLEDLINTVSEGCQADAGAIPGKPVFTQEVEDTVIDAVNKLKGEWPEFTQQDAANYHPTLEYHFLGCRYAIVRVRGGKNVMREDFLRCVKDMTEMNIKPTFTQEMCDNGEYPMVGCELMYLAGAGLKLPGGGFSKGYWDKTKVIARHNDLTWLESHGIQEIHYYMIKPIDNRNEHEKALDWISEYKSIPKMMLCDIKRGKCPWLKWVGE